MSDMSLLLVPGSRGRWVFTFHRPETLAEWARQITVNPEVPTFRARLKAMPPLDERGLRSKQAEAIRNTEQALAEDRPRTARRPGQQPRRPGQGHASGLLKQATGDRHFHVLLRGPAASAGSARLSLDLSYR
jgi:hypothetical protein